MQKRFAGKVVFLALCLVLLPYSPAGGTSVQDKVGGAVDKTFDFIDDGAITAKIKGALLTQDNIKSTNISVETKNGVVTLSGEARTTTERGLIIDTVTHVEGVKAVRAENLKVSNSTAQSADEYVSDAAITAELKGRLAAESPGYLTGIKAETRHGIVSLHGSVNTEKEFINIQRIAMEVDGVRGVRNYLVIGK